jgi:hypothetical protein
MMAEPKEEEEEGDVLKKFIEKAEPRDQGPNHPF